jgi:hypothetical protein
MRSYREDFKLADGASGVRAFDLAVVGHHADDLAEPHRSAS